MGSAEKLPNERVQGVITFIFIKNDKYGISNYRLNTITDILDKIRGAVISNRLKPYMNSVTEESQNAYKVGRSTIDVLYLLNNQIKIEGTENLRLRRN